MVGQLHILFEKYDFMHGVITFMKHDVYGDNIMLHYWMSPFETSMGKYESTCFSYIMFKTCQYVTNDEKVNACLKHVNVKATQGSLQKIIHGLKNLESKGKNENRNVLKGFVALETKKAIEWKSFKVYHTRWKGLSPYCSIFLPYILIPIKNNESKVLKIFKKTIF